MSALLNRTEYIVFTFSKDGQKTFNVKQSTNLESAKESANFWDERVDVALYKKSDEKMTLLFGREVEEFANPTKNLWQVKAVTQDGRTALTVRNPKTGRNTFTKAEAEALRVEKQAQLVGDLYTYQVEFSS